MGASHALTACAWLLALTFAELAAAKCGICQIRNGRTTDYALPATGDLGICNQYQANSCCTPQTAQLITAGKLPYPADVIGQSQDMVPNPAVCDADTKGATPMSQDCKDMFKYFDCFKECDVNAGKYRKYDTCVPDGSEVAGIPINGAYCDRWFNTCLNDYFCVNQALKDQARAYYFDQFTMAKNCTVASKNCQTFGDLFVDGQDFCTKMFGGEVVYDDRNKGYDLSWDPALIQGNPNDAALTDVAFPTSCPDHAAGNVDNQTLYDICGGDVVVQPVSKDCEVCHVRNAQTRIVSSPVPDLPGACAKYAGASCCTEETSLAIESNTFWDPEFDYRWDRCYVKFPELKAAVDADPDLSAKYAKCEKWFHQEHCLYECDVSIGKFRKEQECPDEEEWWNLQMNSIDELPIKGPECDAWYEDCKDMNICICTSKDDCKDRANSFFGLTLNECTNVACSKTVGDLFPSGNIMCSTLFGSSYKYGDIAGLAYSIAWGTDLVNSSTATTNPNSKINTNIAYPEVCTREVELGVAQEVCTDPTYDPRLVPQKGAASAAFPAALALAGVAILLAALQ